MFREDTLLPQGQQLDEHLDEDDSFGGGGGKFAYPFILCEGSGSDDVDDLDDEEDDDDGEEEDKTE